MEEWTAIGPLLKKSRDKIERGGDFFFAWQCTGMFTDKRQRRYTKCLIERSHSFQAGFIVLCTFHDYANLYEDTTSPISQTGG